jgi:adenylate cyclase
LNHRCRDGKLPQLVSGDHSNPMQNAASISQPIRFGTFELDLRARELRKEGFKVKLQEQPFQILTMLLESPGQLVTREELRNRLWPSDTFVDFDHGLNKAINKLREALGDSAEKPHFIATLARRGYRFLESPAVPISEASIAVLPFLSLSADSENELFADGMTEEIISTLMQVKNLHVVARTSSFSFKGKHVDLRTVGQQLNVRTVLEGSVRRSGNRLRITAQLVNAADGYHLWSQRYDRELKDIFVTQEEIAKSIAETLEVTIDSEKQPLVRAGTENLEAFKFYLQGRALFFQRGLRLPASVEFFKQAVSLDPKYGLAWSGLADAYNMVAFYGLARPEACLPYAKAAAQKAMTLDPLLAEAHASLAMSHLFCDWDRSSAEREFLYSLDLKPRNSLALCWYGMFYLHWIAGRFDEALAQTKLAVQVDPLSAYARAMQAFAYLTLDVDRCLEMAEEILQLDSESFLGRWAQLTALNLLGRFAEAAEVGELALKISGRAPWIMGSLSRTYAALGRHTDSKALYMELRWRSKREYMDLDVLGWAACSAGRLDEAIRHEQEANAIGDPSLIVAKYWPDFAELRKDPRFDEILRSRGWT